MVECNGHNWAGSNPFNYSTSVNSPWDETAEQITPNHLRVKTLRRVMQCVEGWSDMMISQRMCVFMNVANQVLWGSVLGVGVFTALFQSLMNNSVLQRTFSTEASWATVGWGKVGLGYPQVFFAAQKRHNDQNLPESMDLRRMGMGRNETVSLGHILALEHFPFSPHITASTPSTIHFIISALIFQESYSFLGK